MRKNRTRSLKRLRKMKERRQRQEVTAAPTDEYQICAEPVDLSFGDNRE